MVDCDCRSRSLTFAQKFGSRQCSKGVPIGSVITWWRVAYSASWICEAASGRIGRCGGLAAAGAPGSGAALGAAGAGEVIRPSGKLKATHSLGYEYLSIPRLPTLPGLPIMPMSSTEKLIAGSPSEFGELKQVREVGALVQSRNGLIARPGAAAVANKRRGACMWMSELFTSTDPTPRRRYATASAEGTIWQHRRRINCGHPMR
jgi:hypothetical protein